MQRGLRGNTFLSFFSPGNKFSFRAPCIYQDRRFKFIPVVPVRYAPLARIVTRLFGGATGCNILRHRARSLEYRCSHFCRFSSAHETRYFLRLGEFLGSFLAVTFTSDLDDRIIIPEVEISVVDIRVVSPESYSATSNLITSIREDSKHRNNLPNV